ncbi:type IV secretory system conjugative DNA transfer family protein [Acidisoma sp. L85]|uniref:type IV secretory system conjugative DNA transfer family protein n=1 Tax=Acidisoma sp. L85 TaxID=1641850 RepID=UPI00131DAACD|nr:type IV secretion system DNA-binding domain-containing protein [Acidisoma sp. L85]
MIRREIVGPQTQFERSAADGFRDVRPTTARLSDALRSSGSGLILCGLASATWFYPASLNLTLPISTLYAAWVLTRRVALPLRLPKSANRKDWNYPDPATRKPQQADGRFLIGFDALTGQELWLTNADIRQHATIPGTTGAGKTTSILSMLANALAQGSGFVLVDGKADNTLYGQVLALARRYGREDDVLTLNFLTASGIKESNTFNPFAPGNADAIRELLASQLGEQRSDDANGVFRGRAVGLIGTVAPVLVWMRDHRGISINIEKIRFALELPWIWTLAKNRIFLVRDPKTGTIIEMPVPEMPLDIVYPLLAYLGELPGYDISVPYNEQRSDKPSEQHGYALMYFTATFSQLSISLGHIFKVESGDVDMRDIVLNRRILVVNLPALENSDDTLAALGKIVVAGLRGMLAQLLGARLEGDAKEIFALKPSAGDSPFYVVFDEVAYYATSGMDRMLAMGRGLNVVFWLAFQELSGIWARLGEKTQSLLGNANLTIAMRQQEANRTREWLQKTAGETAVMQATTYHGGGVGQYREAQHAEVRQVSRVDWQDLQNLLEGEAVVLFGGRRIYAKVFHAKLDTSGPTRLNRPIMLAAPQKADIRADVGRVQTIVENLVSGRTSGPDRVEESEILTVMLDAFAARAKERQPIAACAAAAIDVAGAKHIAMLRAGHVNPDGGEEAEPPVTDLLPMLETMSACGFTAAVDPGMPTSPISADDMRMLVNIETSASGSPQVGRRNSLAALAERDGAREDRSTPARPSEISAPILLEWITALIDQLAA